MRSERAAQREHGHPINLVAPTDELDSVVRTLAYQADLEQWLDRHPGWETEAVRGTEACIAAAFNDRDEKALLAIHRSLKILYDLHLIHHPVASENQYNPLLTVVRNKLERAWMASERRRSSVGCQTFSRDGTEFQSYFRNWVRSHPAANHRIYDFLETEASKSQMIAYFLNDCLLNVRFFDIIVLSALGSDGGVRREISENLWDESGRGVAENAHTVMFTRLIRLLNVDCPEEDFADRAQWQDLAGYNLFLYLGLTRRNYHQFIGCLAATELLDPGHYTKLVQGCRRLGLDQQTDLGYYTEHIEVDIKHGDGWIANVMLPLLKIPGANPQSFALGAELRLNTCLDYYDCLSKRLRTGRTDERQSHT